MAHRLRKVLIVRQFDFLFLDRAHQTLGITVLAWLTDGSDAEFHAELFQTTTYAVAAYGTP